MTVAAVDSSTSGNKPQSGTMRKNGFSMAALSPRISAPKIIENERGKHDGEPREACFERPLIWFVSQNGSTHPNYGAFRANMPFVATYFESVSGGDDSLDRLFQ